MFSSSVFYSGCIIEASINMHCLNTFKRMLRGGSVYELSVFVVTWSSPDLRFADVRVAIVRSGSEITTNTNKDFPGLISFPYLQTSGYNNTTIDTQKKLTVSYLVQSLSFTIFWYIKHTYCQPIIIMNHNFIKR